MSAFDACSRVELRGLEILLPFLEKEADHGRFVTANKGPLAKFLQQTAGDALFMRDAEEAAAVDFKVEEKRIHGNFFLETWSNKGFDRRKPGWMFTSRTDLIWYYFLEEDALYEIPFRKLFRWAFYGGEFNNGHIWDYPERVQGKREQLNQTCGACVPIQVIKDEVGFRLMHPREALAAQEVATNPLAFEPSDDDDEWDSLFERAS